MRCKQTLLRSLLEEGDAHRPEETCTERERERVKMAHPAFKGFPAHANGGEGSEGETCLHQTLMIGDPMPCTSAQGFCMSALDTDNTDGRQPTNTKKGFS